MAIEERPSSGGTIATVVATAALTLAIGVTVAALGGYLAPAGERPAAGPPAPVVFVPVTQDRPPPDVPAPLEPDTPLAAVDPAEREGGNDDDHHHGERRHHEREHDHGDDD